MTGPPSPPRCRGKRQQRSQERLIGYAPFYSPFASPGRSAPATPTQKTHATNKHQVEKPALSPFTTHGRPLRFCSCPRCCHHHHRLLPGPTATRKLRCCTHREFLMPHQLAPRASPATCVHTTRDILLPRTDPEETGTNQPAQRVARIVLVAAFVAESSGAWGKGQGQKTCPSPPPSVPFRANGRIISTTKVPRRRYASPCHSRLPDYLHGIHSHGNRNTKTTTTRHTRKATRKPQHKSTRVLPLLPSTTAALRSAAALRCAAAQRCAAAAAAAILRQAKAHVCFLLRRCIFLCL